VPGQSPPRSDTSGPRPGKRTRQPENDSTDGRVCRKATSAHGSASLAEASTIPFQSPARETRDSPPHAKHVTQSPPGNPPRPRIRHTNRPDTNRLDITHPDATHQSGATRARQRRGEERFSSISASVPAETNVRERCPSTDRRSRKRRGGGGKTPAWVGRSRGTGRTWQWRPVVPFAHSDSTQRNRMV